MTIGYSPRGRETRGRFLLGGVAMGLPLQTPRRRELVECLVNEGVVAGVCNDDGFVAGVCNDDDDEVNEG